MCLPRFGSKNEFSLLFLIRILTKRGGLKKTFKDCKCLAVCKQITVSPARHDLW